MKQFSHEDDDLPRNTTVMLIDDSPIDNYVNEKVMRTYGFAQEVLVYKRANLALEFLLELDKGINTESLIPEFIFLDLNMPIMDGFEFLEAYEGFTEKIKDRIKIVVLSSTVNPADMARTIKNRHVITFLNKPLLKHNLEQVINSMVYKKAS
jgi:CheY-like chemotaxis protein